MCCQLLDTARKACETGSPKLVSPALETVLKLAELGLVRGTVMGGETESARCSASALVDILILFSAKSSAAPVSSAAAAGGAAPTTEAAGGASGGAQGGDTPSPSSLQQPQAPAGSPSLPIVAVSSGDGATTPTAPGGEMVAVCLLPAIEEHSQGVQTLLLRACLASATGSGFAVHDVALLGLVRTCYEVFVRSKTAAVVENAKGIIRQIVNHVFCRFEAANSSAVGSTPRTPRPATPGPPPSSPYLGSEESSSSRKMVRSIIYDIIQRATSEARGGSSVVRPPPVPSREPSANSLADEDGGDGNRSFLDCLLVFRSLCKLSVKDLPKDQEDSEFVRKLRSLVFSLELLYSIVENAGPALRSDQRFVDLVRKYLCPSLSHNGTSSVPRIFKYALSIFRSMIKHFRVPLRHEVGVIMSNLFLPVLESPNSSHQQKWLVLQLVQYLCGIPQTLAEVMLNYDCELKSPDLLVRIFADLARVIQTPNAALTPEAASEEKALKVLCLDCVVLATRVLLNWGKVPAVTQGGVVRPALQQSTVVLPRPNAANEVTVNVEDTEKFKGQRKHKSNIQEAVKKFNAGPNDGIEFMKKVKLVEDNPESFVKFLKATDGISKSSLGDYICGSKPRNKAALKAFVKTFSFKGMDLDEGVRHFLGTFLICGEGGVIYRVIENFADQYFADNKDPEGSTAAGYATSDAIFQVAYAMVVLATDAHNPNVKVKVTFDEWVHMIETLGLKMDPAFLRPIYDRTVARKLELNADPVAAMTAPAATSAQGGDTSSRHRHASFLAEASSWTDVTNKLLGDAKTDGTAASSQTPGPYYRVTAPEYAPLVFESVSRSVQDAIVSFLESTEDSHVVEQCVTGLDNGVHIACASSPILKEEREHFVSALEKTGSGVTRRREARHKEVLAVKTILQLANSEGERLQDSWDPVLRIVCILEEAGVLGASEGKEESGSNTPVAAQSHGPRVSTSTRLSTGAKKSIDLSRGGSSQSGDSSAAAAPELANPKALSKAVEADNAEKLFAGMEKYSARQCTDVMRSFCRVSLSEVGRGRTWALSKVVELSGRLMAAKGSADTTWLEIWSVVKTTLSTCASMEQPAIWGAAMKLIFQFCSAHLDKFAERQRDDSFHREILSAYELVVTRSGPEPSKIAALQSLRQVVVLNNAVLGAGWKAVFGALTLVAEEECSSSSSQQSQSKIFQTAFELLCDVKKSYYATVVPEFYVEMVTCFVAFGKNPRRPEVSRVCIAQLRSFCAVQASELKKLKKSGTSAASLSSAELLDQLNGWFPVLAGLGAIVGHPHIDVRTEALSELFGVFKNQGKLFSPKFWELSFRTVLIPIFDEVRKDGADNDTEWVNTTFFGVAQSLVSLFTQYFSSVSFLLADLLELLCAFIARGSGIISDVGSTCFYQLVRDNAELFTRPMWSSVIALLEQVLSKDVELMQQIIFVPEPSPVDASNKEPPQAQSAGVSPAPSVDKIPLSSHSASPSLPKPASVGAPAAVAPKAGTDLATAERESRDAIEYFVCVACRKRENASVPLLCPVCRSATYCTLKCQRADWAEHEKSCSGSKTASSTMLGPSRLRRTSTQQQQRFIVPLASPQPVRVPTKMADGLTPKLIKARVEVMRVVVKAADEVVLKQYSRLCTDDLARVVTAVSATSKATFDALVAKGTRAMLQAERGLLDLFEKKDRELMSFQIRLTFSMFAEKDTDSSIREGFAETWVLSLCSDLLLTHLPQEAVEPRVPTLSILLTELLSIRPDQYKRHISELYRALTSAISHPNPAVRDLVSRNFELVGNLFSLTPLR